MTTIQFLAEWALRSSILILAGALLLRALRVKDASIRLAAWAAMLCGSLAIPALTAALPRVPMMAAPAARVTVDAPAAAGQMATLPAAPRPVVSAPPRFDWARAAAMLYLAVALALLLRLAVGLALSLRLRRASLSTGRFSEGIEIRESPRVRAPVTLGIFAAGHRAAFRLARVGGAPSWRRCWRMSARTSGATIRPCSCSRRFIGRCCGTAR